MKLSFKEKVLQVVSQIPEGDFLTYKEVANLAGNRKAWRVVGNILSKNRNRNLPCHRVIRSDNLVGNYFGKKELSYLKLALLLKEGVIAVMPTDTIYGICASVFKKKAVEKIYKLKKRTPNKPLIILISKMEELNLFGVQPDQKEKEFLKKIWPGKISVILKLKDKNKIKKFRYLIFKNNTLAFRLPKSNFLKKVLEISGPIVAPSVNFEGEKPAKNIKEAKRYFGSEVIYFDGGELKGEPSTLIFLEEDEIKILREGANVKKILKLVNL